MGLADTKLSPLTSHSLIQKPKKLKCPPKTTMTLLVSLASYMLASLHLHIYNNNTSTLYHLTWEFEKPFIISFITLRFIQPKINELLFCKRFDFKIFLENIPLTLLGAWAFGSPSRLLLVLWLPIFLKITDNPEYRLQLH